MAVVLAVTQCLGVMELTLCPTESWNFTRGGDTGQAGRSGAGKGSGRFLCEQMPVLFPVDNEGGRAGGVVWPGMATQNWEGEKLEEKG